MLFLVYLNLEIDLGERELPSTDRNKEMKKP